MWAAEQTLFGSPNIAVWHCTQAAEKTMKGFLRCKNKDYDYAHELTDLLDAVEELITLSSDTTKYIQYLNRFGVGLRYKNMSTDPTVDDARTAIARTKQIMQEFRNQPSVSGFMREAEEVHLKILKASYEKYSQESPRSG